MNILDNIRGRIQKFRELRAGLNIQYDVDRALEALRISQENVGDMKVMAATPGWQLLSVLCENEISKLRNANFRLCSDPVTNQKEMMVNYAMVRVLERLLKLVDDTLKTEPFIEQEHEDLITINNGMEYEQ